jgi:5-formyltetrahydrofolate cyclo-ligase
MTVPFSHPLHARKKTLRQQAIANRIGQARKDEISRDILATFMLLPEYSTAETVMFYAHVGSEVRTRDELAAAAQGKKRVVVPYCAAGRLHLFHLQDINELETGTYGILEPRQSLRSDVKKSLEVQAVDLFMVPGVAFDRQGGRLGVGKGYYDKLLQHARHDALLVGLAFECQLFDQLPRELHDVIMDRVITEAAIYRGSRNEQAAGD